MMSIYILLVAGLVLALVCAYLRGKLTSENIIACLQNIGLIMFAVGLILALSGVKS